MRLGAAGIALCLSVFVVSGRPAAATSAPPPTPASVSIASLNMAGQPRIEDALASWVRRRGSDVVLLQEVGGHGVDGATFVASLGHQLGYHFVYAPADRFGDEVTQGLAIMSRGPIDDVRILPLDHHHLRFRSRCRIAQAATVQTDAGRVRVRERPPRHADQQQGSRRAARARHRHARRDRRPAGPGRRLQHDGRRLAPYDVAVSVLPAPGGGRPHAAGRKRVSHALHGRPRDLQVSGLADPTRLALSERARRP